MIVSPNPLVAVETTLRTDVSRRLFQNSGMIVVADGHGGCVSALCPDYPGETGRGGLWGLGSDNCYWIIHHGAPSTNRRDSALRISMAYGERDVEEARRLVQIGIGLAFVLFAVLTPAIWLVRFPLVRLLNLPADYQETAALIIVFVVGIMALGGINDALVALVNGYQRTGFTVLVQAGASIFGYIISAVVLFLGYRIWSLWVGFICTFLCTGVGLYLVGARSCGRVDLIPALPRISDLQALSSYSGLMLTGSVSAALRGSTDKIILASMASPVWAGYYGIAARLANLVMEASNFFYAPLIAASGALHAQKDWDGIKRLYSKMMTVVPLVVGAIVVILAGVYDRLLVFWLGLSIPEVSTILLLLLWGNAVAVILTGPGTAVCKGIGRVGIETRYVVLNLVLNVVLTVALVVWLGAIGTVVASAVSWSAAAVYFLFVLHKNTDLPVCDSLRGVRAMAAIAYCAMLARISANSIGFEATRIQALKSALVLSLLSSVLFALSYFIVIRDVKLQFTFTNTDNQS